MGEAGDPAFRVQKVPRSQALAGEHRRGPFTCSSPEKPSSRRLTGNLRTTSDTISVDERLTTTVPEGFTPRLSADDMLRRVFVETACYVTVLEENPLPDEVTPALVIPCWSPCVCANKTHGALSMTAGNP